MRVLVAAPNEGPETGQIRGPGAPPTPLTPLLAREQELAEVAALLGRPHIRLVTLTGPGGVGKTRLALAVAADVAAAFPDGVWFVDLAPIRDPSLVASAIAATLDLRPIGTEPVADRLAAALQDRRALLVLDNFEQILDAAPLVVRLLAACPKLTILVTSRVRLRVADEREYVVAPLAVTADVDPIAGEAASPSAAVRLFVERARALQHDFALTPDNAATLAAICAQLDGLPLAIELAATRIKILPPTALQARLTTRLSLLTGGSRDRPDRQRTMRDAIAWSHDLLSDAERALFRRLAVFAGGCTLPAAQAVASTPSDPEVVLLDGIGTLVDASLLHLVPGTTEPRYRMLETIREFAVDQLEASGEAETIRARHAAHFVAVAVAAELWQIWPGVDLVGRYDAMEREHDNLRAALAWLIARGLGAQAQLLSSASYQFWKVRGHLREARVWAERVLATPGGTTETRRYALQTAADYALDTGDWNRAAALAAEALAIAASALPPEAAVAHARQVLGDGADGLTDAAVMALARVTEGPRAAIASAHHRLGRVVDDPVAAAGHETLALAFGRDRGNPILISESLGRLGLLTMLQGDGERATVLAEEGLAIARDPAIGDEEMIALALYWAAAVALGRGDLGRADAMAREALALYQQLKSPTGPNDFLFILGAVALRTGQPTPAVRWWGAAAAQAVALDFVQIPYLRAWFAQFIDAAQSALGADAYDAAWHAGHILPIEAAVAEALAVASDPATATPTGARQAGHGLTPREIELLRLLAAGRSNPEIAAALFISRRTVTTHLTRIFAKLGVARRDEAIARAFRLGLVDA